MARQAQHVSKGRCPSKPLLAFSIMALLGAGNCYRPELKDCTVQCSGSRGCPDGQHCSLGLCTANLECNAGSDGNEDPVASAGDSGGGVGGASAGGGVSGADDGPFRVISVVPEHGASSVERTTELGATFSADVDPSTISTASWTLLESGVPVSGTVSSDGVTATLMPGKPLAPLAECTASLSSEIADQAGNALAESYEWSFQARDATWDAQDFVAERVGVGGLAVAIDEQENVTVVMSYLDYEPISRVAAARYYATSDTWDQPVVLDIDGGYMWSPSIVMLGNGDALAVWQQAPAEQSSRIFANHFVAASGQWQGAKLITSDDLGDASGPRLATDGQGNAIAVWSQYDGTQLNVWANRFTSQQWQGASIIDDYQDGHALGPRVAMNRQGTAMAVWHQVGGSSSRVWASHFALGSWQVPVPADDAPEGGSAPAVAMDGQGNAFAVWNYVDDVTLEIGVRANRFVAASETWGEPESLTTAGGYQPQTTIAADTDGNAIAAWVQVHELGSSIRVNRFSAASSGWGDAVYVDQNVAETVSSPSLALDDRGNALLAWTRTQSGGWPFDIRVSRFVAKSATWTSMELEDDPEHAEQPVVAINGQGVGVAAWVKLWTGNNDWYVVARPFH